MAALEYAIIVGVIVVGVGGAVALFQNEIIDLLQSVTDDVATLETTVDTAVTDD